MVLTTEQILSIALQRAVKRAGRRIDAQLVYLWGQHYIRTSTQDVPVANLRDGLWVHGPTVYLEGEDETGHTQFWVMS